MRGEFENIWKDTFEGASITPSDKVWQGISAKMDGTNGRRSWVTILLIAATVTMAFAFPLTVGNSEYEFKPKVRELVATNDVPPNVDGFIDSAPESQFYTAPPPTSPSGLPDTGSSIGVENNIGQIHENIRSEDSQSQDLIMSTLPEGILTYQSLQPEPESGLTEYYILPALRIADKQNKSLIAFGNINSGRQSALTSLSSMEFLDAAADFEGSTNMNSRNNSNRSEEGGATFYLGIGAELPVSKRLNISAGLGYQNQRLNGSSNTIYEQDGQQFPVGIYDPIVPGTIFLSENYDYVTNNQFISVPFGVKYAIIDKHVKFRLGLGLSPDFMLSHKVSATEYGTRSTPLSATAYNTVQFTGLLNLDILLPLQANYSLAIETGLRQGLVPYVQEGSEYATSFNLGVIFFYQIRK